MASPFLPKLPPASAVTHHKWLWQMVMAVMVSEVSAISIRSVNAGLAARNIDLKPHFVVPYLVPCLTSDLFNPQTGRHLPHHFPLQSSLIFSYLLFNPQTVTIATAFGWFRQPGCSKSALPPASCGATGISGRAKCPITSIDKHLSIDIYYRRYVAILHDWLKWSTTFNHYLVPSWYIMIINHHQGIQTYSNILLASHHRQWGTALKGFVCLLSSLTAWFQGIPKTRRWSTWGFWRWCRTLQHF